MYSATVKQLIQVRVLGILVGTGIVVLIDRNGRIWFYDPPDLVDPHLKGMTSQAVFVIMNPGDVMTKYLSSKGISPQVSFWT